MRDFKDGERWWFSAPAVAVVALGAALAGCAGAEDWAMPEGEVEAMLEGAGDYPQEQVGGVEVEEAAIADEAELPELGAGATLAEYLEYAALNSAGLEAAWNEWRAAVERIEQVRTLPDPRLTYQYFFREVETRVGPQEHSLALAQTFPWFGKLELAGKAAGEGAAAAWARYRQEREDLYYEVKDAFYDYYYVARAVEITAENVDLLDRLERVVRGRFRTAVAGQPDLIRIQVELGRLEDQLASLEDLQGVRAARLNAALNRPVDAPLARPGEIEYTAVELDEAELLSRVKQENPQLEGLARRMAMQRQEKRLAELAYYPDITVGATWVGVGDAFGGMRPSDEGKDAVMGSVSINVPIWRNKYAAGVREQQAEYHAARGRWVERYNALAAAVKEGVFGVRDGARKAELYGNALIPRAREALAVAESGFMTGEVTYVNLIDSQRQLLAFELEYYRAVAEHGSSLARLEAITATKLEMKNYN